MFISKFIVPKSFERSCITAKSFEKFHISQYISKYFEIYFEIFQLRNILKIVSKYFESGLKYFSKYFVIEIIRNILELAGLAGSAGLGYVTWIMPRMHWTIFSK